MTSLCQGMELHCNSCIAFKNAVYKYFINKIAYFRFRLFCSSIFANNATLSWQRAIPKNIGPSSRTSKPMAMQFTCTSFFMMASGQWQVKYVLKISMVKAFATLIWDIRKSTFFKYYQKCYYSYHKNFHFCELCWRQCRQGNDCFYDLFFDCEEGLTFFKIEHLY